eukprot:TRINITY_DN5543_c1_g1_i1.p2 TRINITY_DN5543_c1_g1~~TRINITY_DN5543_c1_g1_i1.p2  ORF type:complete len:146 (+),score=37.61 TRINITY_DN5543_c1_g1_i1:467-904(+)
MRGSKLLMLLSNFILEGLAAEPVASAAAAVAVVAAAVAVVVAATAAVAVIAAAVDTAPAAASVVVAAAGAETGGALEGFLISLAASAARFTLSTGRNAPDDEGDSDDDSFGDVVAAGLDSASFDGGARLGRRAGSCGSLRRKGMR